ncbi:MAG TPA: hypothetical protein EYP62_05440 [Kiritimatiellae bacterium]|nr:hypothetical protein [Kiritimatiellia bacterium]
MKQARIASLALGLLWWLCSFTRGDWVRFRLPDLSSGWGAVALEHLPDGRLLYGESGNLYRQETWDSPNFPPFTGEPDGLDPSFIAAWDADTAVVGAGGWSPSLLYRFAPSDVDADFTDIGVSVQNYHGVFRDAAGLYTGGADTGPDSDQHGIRYISLDGSINRILIDGISTYSCGFDIDRNGDLYVGDNDDGKVYRFTAPQLAMAMTGTPLTVDDGELVHDFGEGGNLTSLAVDGLGRIWAAGWMTDGIKVYNPAIDAEFTYIPDLTNCNYKVDAFEKDGTFYISYLTESDPATAGSAVYYGYDQAAAYAIPEPRTAGLIALGVLLCLRPRRWSAA